MIEIKITWEGPYSTQTVVDDYKLDDNVRNDFGLYQIYGPHDLYLSKKRRYEENVLLYIGKTVSGGKFSGRIAKHGFCKGPGFKVYLGRIVEADDDKDFKNWEKDVGDAEKILINAYTPPYNACGTGDLRYDQLHHKSNFIILNEGEIMDLERRIESDSVVYPMNK